PDELRNCSRWLAHDLAGLRLKKAMLALGKVGHDAVLRFYRQRGVELRLADFPFAHGAVHRLDAAAGAAEAGAVPLVDAYHVSFQNTNTGRLTPAKFDAALAEAKALAGLGQLGSPPGSGLRLLAQRVDPPREARLAPGGGVLVQRVRLGRLVHEALHDLLVLGGGLEVASLGGHDGLLRERADRALARAVGQALLLVLAVPLHG